MFRVITYYCAALLWSRVEVSCLVVQSLQRAHHQLSLLALEKEEKR